MAQKTTTIDLGSKPYASPYYSIGREVCHNMYLEFAQAAEAKAKYYLLKIPGLRRMTQPSANIGACRGMITTGNGRTFAALGHYFCEVFASGDTTTIGTFASYTGVVSMAENGFQLIAVDGVNGWIFDYVTATFTKITDESFPGNSAGTLAPTHVTYLDTYFIANNPNSNDYFWSESYYQRAHDNTVTDYDPAEPNGYWSPINSGKKIGKSDNIVGLANVNNYLWLFGANSNEIHYDTGNTDQLFARYEGAILNFGCSAPYSIATLNNNVYWLAADTSGMVGIFTNEGVQPKRVSTRGIEQIIEDFNVYSDAIGFCYNQAGHSFYVLQFPHESRTFVYDSVTDSWHERTYLDANTGLLSMWPGMFITKNFDRTLTGYASHSQIFDLDPQYYQNDNPNDTGVTYIRCAKNTPIAFSQGRLVRFDMGQIVCSQGWGLPVNTAAGVGKAPKVFLSYSNDTGITYQNTREAYLGQQGQYGNRSMFPALGAGRNRVFLITMMDPVPFILVSLIVLGEDLGA